MYAIRSYYDSFGNWIKHRRKALDLTQQDLADLVGCSHSLMYKIEADSRRPSRQIAELIADHLAIPNDHRELFVITSYSIHYTKLYDFVGVTKSEFSIIGGAVMLGSAMFAIPFGILADRWNKRAMIAAAIVGSSLGGILLSLVRTLPLLALTGLIWQAFSTASGIASVAWLKDLLPEQSRVV